MSKDALELARFITPVSTTHKINIPQKYTIVTLSECSVLNQLKKGTNIKFLLTEL